MTLTRLKKPALLLLSLTLFFAFSTLAFAQNNNSDNNQAAYGETWNKHQDKMQGLSEQLWAKETELGALSNNTNTKQSEIQALIKEMSNLRSQMNTEKNSFNQQQAKDGYPAYGSGSSNRNGWGHGRHMKGYSGGYSGGGCGGGHHGGYGNYR